MSKTAIQQEIEIFDGMKNASPFKSDTKIIRDTIFDVVISQLEQLKEVEKQNIIEAYQSGMNNAFDKKPFIDSNNYYNETFKD